MKQRSSPHGRVAVACGCVARARYARSQPRSLKVRYGFLVEECDSHTVRYARLTFSWMTHTTLELRASHSRRGERRGLEVCLWLWAPEPCAVANWRVRVGPNPKWLGSGGRAPRARARPRRPDAREIPDYKRSVQTSEQTTKFQKKKTKLSQFTIILMGGCDRCRRCRRCCRRCCRPRRCRRGPRTDSR